jgi:preprotein translocase YajC subunit
MSFLLDSAFAADEVQTGVAVPSGDVAPVDLSADKMLRDNMLLLGALFFIFYFVLIKPQQKRVKLHQEMIKSLKKGDKVVTSGGIIGTIVKLDGDDVVVLEIAQSVRVRVAKSAISEFTSDKSVGGEGANDN